MSNSSSGKFFLGVLLGGTLGAVIGMLLAPRSGVETREMIRDEVASRYYESKGNLIDKTESLKERATEKAGGLRDKVTSLAGELEEIGRRTLHKIKESGASAPKNSTEA